MSARETKRLCSGLFKRLVGKNLRTLVISAGFPYHKSPHLYQWLWVFILLPFLEEDTLNELRENYGKRLRALYRVLIRHPQAFDGAGVSPDSPGGNPKAGTIAGGGGTADR